MFDETNIENVCIQKGLDNVIRQELLRLTRKKITQKISSINKNVLKVVFINCSTAVKALLTSSGASSYI